MKLRQVNQNTCSSRSNESGPRQVFLYFHLMAYAARGKGIKLLIGQTLRLSLTMLTGHFLLE